MSSIVIPGNANMTTIANTRTYLGSGGAQMVNDSDARVLTANGWVAFGAGGGLAGPTTSRPSPAGGSYFDTTLSETVTWVPTWPLIGTSGSWCNSSGVAV